MDINISPVTTVQVEIEMTREEARDLHQALTIAHDVLPGGLNASTTELLNALSSFR